MDPQRPKKRSGNVKYVEIYDFKRPKLFSKEIMRTIGSIHDAIARGLSRIYSSSLRYKVDVYLSRIEQHTPTDFIKSIESPSVIYLLEGQLLGGEVIVNMPPEFCIHIIERQSGGPGVDLSHKRILTTIEEKIISRMMVGIEREIINAWQPYSSFRFETRMYENKPENVHLGTVDPAITAKIVIDLGSKKIEVGISYTYSMLKKSLSDAILKKDKGASLERLNPVEHVAYQRTLEKANVRIQPLLGTTRLTLDEVFGLKEGDTIPLKQLANEPLDIMVNGVAKLKGFPGLKQGRKAIKVYEINEEINEQELV